jgi:glycosyltransferase involved in cell wall biosynthesis
VFYGYFECREEGQFLRYLFDLTTTAQWHGPAVGIVRVEQELARRARRCLGDNVAFCLYDRSGAAVLVIDDTVADDLLTGRIRIDFATPPPAPQGHVHKARRRLRAALLRNATAYHIFQRLRGRSFTREQILQFQAAQHAGGQAAIGSTVAARYPDGATVALAELPHRPAQLGAGTIIISGGLDWQYKDLRALWELKQTYGFSYCAIIYDLIAVRFPHFVGAAYAALLTDYFGELLWLADQVMCISQSTRRDWLRHADEVGAGPAPSAVFPLGCDVPSGPSQKSPKIELPSQLQGKRFALFVSTIEPRKNHRMLYEAWDECIRTKQIDRLRDRLVFAGRRGWAVEDLLREIVTNPLTRDTIVLLHEISDEQLSMLYRSCAFALFPSMYEGFGLPLVEALGYGKLCVSSNAGALSEIGGDLVMRLDPRDTLAWSHVIGRLMSCAEECEAWEERIRQRYRPTTWDDAANSFFSAVADPEINLNRMKRSDSLSGA